MSFSKILGNGVLTIFEKDYFSIPINYDECLIQAYGKDYMKIPPIEERRIHTLEKLVL